MQPRAHLVLALYTHQFVDIKTLLGFSHQSHPPNTSPSSRSLCPLLSFGHTTEIDLEHLDWALFCTLRASHCHPVSACINTRRVVVVPFCWCTYQSHRLRGILVPQPPSVFAHFCARPELVIVCSVHLHPHTLSALPVRFANTDLAAHCRCLFLPEYASSCICWVGSNRPISILRCFATGLGRGTKLLVTLLSVHVRPLLFCLPICSFYFVLK